MHGLSDLTFLLQLTCAQWDGWNGNLGTFLCGWTSYKPWCSRSYRGYRYLRKLALIWILSLDCELYGLFYGIDVVVELISTFEFCGHERYHLHNVSRS